MKLQNKTVRQMSVVEAEIWMPMCRTPRYSTLNTLLRNIRIHLNARCLGSSAKAHKRDRRTEKGFIIALVITPWFCDPFIAHRYRLGSFKPIDGPSECPSMPLTDLSVVLPSISLSPSPSLSQHEACLFSANWPNISLANCSRTKVHNGMSYSLCRSNWPILLINTQT